MRDGERYLGEAVRSVLDQTTVVSSWLISDNAF
jgi:hypothetical protein